MSRYLASDRFGSAVRMFEAGNDIGGAEPIGKELTHFHKHEGCMPANGLGDGVDLFKNRFEGASGIL
jgi:hypothetical protein